MNSLAFTVLSHLLSDANAHLSSYHRVADVL